MLRTALIASIAALMLLAGCATPAGDAGPAEAAPPVAPAAGGEVAATQAPKAAAERPPRSAPRPSPAPAPVAAPPAAPAAPAAAAGAVEQSPGARKLAEGIELYDKGDFNAAIRLLQAPEIGAEPLPARLSASKYLAFSYCVTQRRAQCRRAFDALLRLDQDFTLSPVEAGHPLWGPVFVQAKKAAEQQAQRAEAARTRKK